MAKESLFNILNNLVDFEGLSVLDLFAGTGSISFEFASRGAARVLCVDTNFKCVGFIRKTAGEYSLDMLHPIKADVLRFLKKADLAYDLIFADPPYDFKEYDRLPEMIFGAGWLNKNAWLIIEHPKSIDFTRHAFFSQQRKYGKVNFSLFNKKSN